MSKREELESIRDRVDRARFILLPVDGELTGLGPPYQDALWLVTEARDRLGALLNLLVIGCQQEGKK